MPGLGNAGLCWWAFESWVRKGQKCTEGCHEPGKSCGIDLNAEADRGLNVLEAGTQEGAADVPLGDDVTCVIR